MTKEEKREELHKMLVWEVKGTNQVINDLKNYHLAALQIGDQLRKPRANRRTICVHWPLGYGHETQDYKDIAPEILSAVKKECNQRIKMAIERLPDVNMKLVEEVTK